MREIVQEASKEAEAPLSKRARSDRQQSLNFSEAQSLDEARLDAEDTNQRLRPSNSDIANSGAAQGASLPQMNAQPGYANAEEPKRPGHFAAAYRKRLWDCTSTILA